MRDKAFFRFYGDEALVNTEYQRLKSFTSIKCMIIAIKSRKKVHRINASEMPL